MDEIVCPGSTTTVFFGASATTPDAPGTCSTDPATMVFGSVRLLAASNSATVVPYSSAMPSNVSPGATLTVVALEGAKGDATTATVKAVPMITSRPILHDRSDISKITATMLERVSDHYKGQCRHVPCTTTHWIVLLRDQHQLNVVSTTLHAPRVQDVVCVHRMPGFWTAQ